MPVVSPFDILAETYDTDFTQSAIGKLQRKRVWQGLYQLLATFNRPLKILEINCGTGFDALALASMGHTVIATDAAAVMIEKAKKRLSMADMVSGRVEFMQCSFNELKDHFANEKFDLVFSNFGGMNCISGNEIKKLSNDLSFIVNDNGYIFLTVMSRWCFWETFYFLSKGKFTKAFRRQKKSVLFKVDGYSMPVFYYSPGQLKNLFRQNFEPVKTYAAGLFIPPSYLEQQFVRNKNWLNRLATWDNQLGNYSVLASLADHFCIIFKKDKR